MKHLSMNICAKRNIWLQYKRLSEMHHIGFFIEENDISVLYVFSWCWIWKSVGLMMNQNKTIVKLCKKIVSSWTWHHSKGNGISDTSCTSSSQQRTVSLVTRKLYLKGELDSSSVITLGTSDSISDVNVLTLF